MTPPQTSRSLARSQQIFAEAEKLLVGGVNSPVRAFKSVGGEPLVIARAEGACLYDVDGNAYLDYIGGWGPAILGHAHSAVVKGIQEQATQGTSFGVTNELELELARMINAALPSMDMIRFVSSGTEATMSAIRAARAFTKRDLILKFDGCYHGHADSFLSQAGSGLATLGIAASAGVPASVAQATVTVDYNDEDAVALALSEHKHRIAAVIVEPVAANMGVVLPRQEFLRAIRKLTVADGALLIFDEVITGFRLAYGGAQTFYGIQPDLTVLGKIIGGGLPVAAYGGRREIMQQVAPLGAAYQAGTLSGNPLGMRAGIETLKQLQRPDFYSQMEAKSERLAIGLRAALRDAKVRGTVQRAGSLLTLFFGVDAVIDYGEAKACDTVRFAEFFRRMRERGILLPPSQFEAWFVSAAHTDADIDRTIGAARESL